MNRRMRLSLLAVASLPLLGAGCAHHHHHDDVVVEARVYADAEPPVDRVEVIPPRPSPDHIWVKGHYIWRGGRYEWGPGRWTLAPRHDAIWIPGHWDREGGRYFWVEGHWQ